MTDKRTQADANAASALLDNPLMQKARQDMREAIVARIIDGDATAPDADHELANLLRAGDMYWRVLEGYLRTGDVDLHNELQRRKVA